MIKELEGVGFSEKEAKVYSLLYQELELSAPKIAKILNLDRRTIYDILDSLFSKGYVTRKKVQNKELFSPINMGVILEDFSERTNNLEKASKLLNEKRKIGSRQLPQINIIQGLNAIKTIVKNATDLNSEIFLMGRGGYLIEQLGKSKYQYISKLEKLNWKMIQTAEYIKKESEFKSRAVRYLPKGIKLDTAFIVFSDMVYLFTKHKEIFLIEIKDKAFAKTYKQYFNIFWKFSAKN